MSTTKHEEPMILYNVTVSIDNRVKDDWLDWMKQQHIPDVMATGYFIEYKLSQILGEEGAPTTTYAIQYLCENTTVFEEYQSKHAKRLQAEHQSRYEGNYGAFRTLLRVISQDTMS